MSRVAAEPIVVHAPLSGILLAMVLGASATAAVVSFLGWLSPAPVPALNLNDVVSVLQNLPIAESYTDKTPWAAVHRDGKITIWLPVPHGQEITGNGANLRDVLADLHSQGIFIVEGTQP